MSALASLAKAGRHPPVPVQLSLADDQQLQVLQWLRVLPGKRYVARALWQGREILAKLYVGARAKTKAEEEVEGIQRLREAGLKTPALFDHGQLPDAAWVICEFIANSRDLTQSAALSIEGCLPPSVVDTPDTAQSPLQYAIRAAESVAQLHRASLLQQDIHPGNFLFKGEDCWLIDAGDVAIVSAAADKSRNLGMFFAQLPEAWWPDLWQSYLASGSQQGEPTLEYDTVCAAAWDWQAWRAKDLATKSVRDCTLFAFRQTFRRVESVWRAEAEELAPLLADLDGALARGALLKDGGSATVGLVQWQGRALVIKRYNLKSFTHRLKRCWRPTRAWHSWQAGHRLRVLGVDTPRPVAMVEERFGFFRSRAYLIAECSQGEDLVSVCEKQGGAFLPRLGQALDRLLQIFARHRISHGDFKATNLLWEQGLTLIDLDAVRWHKGDRGWQRAHQKDIRRLLRNWDSESPEAQQLSQALAGHMA